MCEPRSSQRAVALAVVKRRQRIPGSDWQQGRLRLRAGDGIPQLRRQSFLDAFEIRLRLQFQREPLLVRGHQSGRQENYEDRKSTRLNSSHDQISYAVFCLKK